MFKKILLGLCLIPVLAHAEVACLEGPSKSGCHNVDVNGEIFKTAGSSVTKQPSLSSERNKVASSKKTSNTSQQVANNRRTQQMNTTEQRIRLRAELIEQRFKRAQSSNSFSALN